MGTYLNPGNAGFLRIIRSEYVDKTGLIGLVNEQIDTAKNLLCISRPRRFGKSYAAQMLCAYYDFTCESHDLFDGCLISKEKDYKKHLNHYHVINLDISGFISESRKKNLPLKNVPVSIDAAILNEVKHLYPALSGIENLNECLLEMVRMTHTKMIFVIDEWDSMIREAKNDEKAQESYLNLLRGWFKNNYFTPEAVAAAYMTGILSIKMDGSQSAISDFEEYSMLDPLGYAEYVGFTEYEVKRRCEIHGRNYESMKKWYDGYTVGEKKSIYNPYSVMKSLNMGKNKSYWKKTSAAEILMTYIDMDQEGLQEDIARLVAGERIVIDTDSFHNDVETFTCKDDVLTLLVHLGYLTYEETSESYDRSEEDLVGFVRVPNEEVRIEFEKILRKTKHKTLMELIKKSDQLLNDTIQGKCLAANKIEIMEEEFP